MPNETPVEHSPRRSPKRPLTPWLWLLPVLVLAGAVWQTRRQAAPPEEPVSNKLTSVTQAPTPAAAKPKPAKAAKPQARRKVIIFVPGDDALLHQKTIAQESPAANADGQTTRALHQLLKASPRDFPAGTRITALETDGNVVRVSLNRAFEKPDFWQGSTQTQMTIYSIVNTVAAQRGGKVKVQLLIEGKPLETLGEFDVAEPLEPKKELVAQS
ncbi:MAG: GerMN domain-containing protein [Armatimonadota bacterium]|nr:GerMN domain-containing protein [Armatimonadota bacterium]